VTIFTSVYADITAGKYGLGQVFDVQRMPPLPAAGSAFTVSNFAQPRRDVGTSYSIPSGGYIQFFYVGGSCSNGKVGIKLYNSSGVYQETISASGSVYGLNNIGFLYLTDTTSPNQYGTFVSNSTYGYGAGVSVTYTPANGLENCSAMSSYGTAPVSAPIDLNMNKPVETFATEIELK